MKNVVYVVVALVGIAFGYLTFLPTPFSCPEFDRIFSPNPFSCPIYEEKRAKRRNALQKFRNKHVYLFRRVAHIVTFCLPVVCACIFWGNWIDLIWVLLLYVISLTSTHCVLENNDITERRELREDWHSNSAGDCLRGCRCEKEAMNE